MRSRLLWVGRPRKQEPESRICDRFLKRINAFLPMDEKVIKPLASSAVGALEMREREARAIVGQLEKGDYLILSDERGRQLRSSEWAGLLKRVTTGGHKRVVWLVGGAWGVPDGIRQKADLLISLTKMTLPHALARAILLEQIYRALSICYNHPYHNEG